MSKQPNPAVTVTIDDALCVEIADGRPDVLPTFASLSDHQRVGLATDAWTVGLRAVMNARTLAEESRLADVGQALVDDVARELDAQVKRQQEAFVQLLQQYFDPQDGRVVARLDGFLRDDGDLSRVMDRFLAPDHGALATTLARSLGESSPLLKRLNPSDSEGIVCIIEARVREVLAANNNAVSKALDPLAPDGAVARFLLALRKDLEKADQDRTKQLALATRALDANDESSLLSRLVRETQLARTSILEAMNADAPNSPLALLKSALSTLLEGHAKTMGEALAAFEERQQKLDLEIREAVARLEARKQSDASTTRGGRLFEDAVLAFAQRATQGAPVTVDDTGSTVGARSACKVGDQVLRFTDESVFAGAAVVVEAKRDASYTVTKALKELEVARSNRMAHVGVFVLARSHATAGFPTFRRFGNDVLVLWDDADEATDPYLHAALTLALALASRQRPGQDEGDIKALADIEHRIEKELKRHDRMRTLAEAIQKKAEELSDELRKGTKGLNLLLRNAKDTLRALNVELATAEVERGEGIGLSGESLDQAREGLSAA